MSRSACRLSDSFESNGFRVESYSTVGHITISEDKLHASWAKWSEWVEKWGKEDSVAKLVRWWSTSSIVVVPCRTNSECAFMKEGNTGLLGVELERFRRVS